MLDSAEAAAMRHTLPYTDAIEPGQLPKAFADRPVATWLKDSTRHFGISIATGVAGVGDCLNQLSHVAAVSLDPDFSAPIAERAAVRYDAARMNEVSLDALSARSGPQVRELLRSACHAFNQTLADRCLEEERGWEDGSLLGAARTQRQKQNMQDSDAGTPHRSQL
jgi:hypothetical protein